MMTAHRVRKERKRYLTLRQEVELSCPQLKNHLLHANTAKMTKINQRRHVCNEIMRSITFEKLCTQVKALISSASAKALDRWFFWCPAVWNFLTKPVCSIHSFVCQAFGIGLEEILCYNKKLCRNFFKTRMMTSKKWKTTKKERKR